MLSRIQTLREILRQGYLWGKGVNKLIKCIVDSQVVLIVKNLPANAGDVRDMGLTPGLGTSLEEGMAIHSSFLAWRISWTEEPGGYSPRGCRESDMTE